MRGWWIIAIGAALGGNARYWLTNLFVARYGPAFPWGTLFINVSGSLLIGFVLTMLGQRLIADPTYRLLLVTASDGALGEVPEGLLAEGELPVDRPCPELDT